MATIAELLLKVDSSQLDSATAKLNKFSDASKKANNAATLGASRIESQNAAMRRAVDVNKELAGATNLAASATNNQEMELEKLKTSIDPVSASIKRLQQQQQQLSKFRSLGMLDEKEYQRLSGRLGETVRRLNTLGATTGKTAKEIAFSMRGLPAQFTDIAVSLQAGQNPLTVFLQQGGQLKDMFGGIRPALQAMGKYILGLITPLNLGIAAFTALGIAAFQGSREVEQLNKSLILTGRDSTTALAGLKELNTTLAEETGETIGKVNKVLTQVARSSKISADSFGIVTKAAIDMERATGQAVEGTIAQFVSIADDPAEAAKKLDSEFNFLTASIYENILSLQDQGRESEAAALLMDEFANTASERSAAIVENLGYVEKAWYGIKSAASDTWDFIKGIGRDAELEDALVKQAEDIGPRSVKSYADAYTNTLPIIGQQIERSVKAWGGLLDKFIGASEESREALLLAYEERLNEQGALSRRQNIAKQAMNQLIDAENEAREAAEKARVQAIEDEKKRLIDLGRSIALPRDIQLKTNLEDAKKELDNFYKMYGLNNPELEIMFIFNVEKAQKALDDFNKKANKPVREKPVRESEAQKRLDNLQQQQAVLEAQRDENDKLTKQERDLIKFNEEIANIKNLKILTADQKSILANETLLRFQLQKNADIAQEIVAKERLANIEAQRFSLQERLIADQNKYNSLLLGKESGATDREISRLKEEANLREDLQERFRELEEKKRTKKIGQTEYGTSLAAETESYNKRLAALRDYYQREDELRGQWAVGAKASFKEFQEAAKDTAGQTKALFDNALNGISDTLVDLVTTGKASFKDLANSILKEIAKIATNKAIASLLGGLGGSGAFGGIFNFLAQEDGGAWKNGVQMFASGGAFTNSVVSRPTAFQHSGGLGVLGEAGAEAILPLTRTSDGKLGVQSVGGAGSTVVAPVSVVVNTDSGSGSSTPGQSDSTAKAVQMAVKMEAERAIQNGLKPGGSIYRAMRGR